MFWPTLKILKQYLGASALDKDVTKNGLSQDVTKKGVASSMDIYEESQDTKLKPLI